MISLNSKGLNVPEKRRMLLLDLHYLKSDIAFVQETYFRDNKLPILKNRSFPLVYHSTHTTAKSRGVSILFSNRVPWSCIESITDPGGGFLFLKDMIGGVKVTLTNLYAPNVNQEVFLSSALTRLADFAEGQLIVGGDFNVL